MKIRYTATALADIDEVFLYIVEDNRAAADRVINHIEDTIALIGKFPRIGRVKYRSVRMLPVRRYPQYLVFYTIENDELVILNVRHAARRYPWEVENR